MGMNETKERTNFAESWQHLKQFSFYNDKGVQLIFIVAFVDNWDMFCPQVGKQNFEYKLRKVES